MESKPPFITTGMHRNGTSLIAGWLNLCGVHMGNDLMEPHVDNPNGFFEDWNFVRFHKKVLDEKNKGYLINSQDYFINLDLFYSEINNILNKASLVVNWGWKDPRTVLLLDQYKDILPKAKYIFVFRHYGYGANSYYFRKFLHLKYLKLKFLRYLYYRFTKRKLLNSYISSWIYFYHTIIEFQKKTPEQCVFIDSDNFKKNPKKYFDLLFKEKDESEINYKEPILHSGVTKHKKIPYNKEADNIYNQLLQLTSNQFCTRHS